MSKCNGYVPIDKNLIQELNNIGRPFTRLEAMFSYTVDQNNHKDGTINGYAKLWNWSRNKVRKFLKEIRTPKGHLKDTRRTPDGHPVHFIDAALRVSEDTRRTLEGHLKDTRRDTTIRTKPKPKKKTYDYDADFLIFWNAYPKKTSKFPAEKAFLKINPDKELLQTMLAGIQEAKKTNGWRKNKGQFIPYPATWLNARGWEDEFEIENQEDLFPH